MIHPYQRRLYGAISANPKTHFPLFPNATTAARTIFGARRRSDVTFGPVDTTPPPTQWIRNQKMMNGIAQASGFHMLTILQPVMGAGDYELSAEEREMLNVAIKSYERKRKPDYLGAVNEFYDKTRPRLAEIPQAADFTDIFRHEQEMYRDARHQSAEGCAIIARRVFDELAGRGLIGSQQ